MLLWTGGDIINKSIYKSFDFEEHFLKWILPRRQQRKVALTPFRECFSRHFACSQRKKLITTVHRYMEINLVFYMFIILISILPGFMSYFLNKIYLFSYFSFGGAFFYHNKNQISHIYSFSHHHHNGFM